VNPPFVNIHIKENLDGDVVDNLSFTLDHNINELPEPKKNQVIPPPSVTSKNRYSIQVGAFRIVSNATRMQALLHNYTGKNIIIEERNGLHIVKITDIDRYNDAVSIRKKLRQNKIEAIILKSPL
jgi:cell division protein FtsN